MKALIKTGSLRKQELKIWTIGHSTRDLSDFVELLSDNGIEALADVRSYPGSRKYPHSPARLARIAELQKMANVRSARNIQGGFNNVT